MDFDIAPSSPVPIYRQIVEQVQRLIASGQLRSGDLLPSVRAVAAQHAINPMTVSKAYSQLEQAGSLVRVRGTGMAVADVRQPPSASEKIAMLRPTLATAARMARELGLDEAEAVALFRLCLHEIPPHE